jgi:hypothetical protein
MSIKGTNAECDHAEKGNLKDPICPALACDLDVDTAASKISSLTVKGEERPGGTQPQFKRQPNPLQEILDSPAPFVTDESK